MLRVALLIHTQYDEYQSNDAGQRHRDDLCHDEHDIADGRPIPGEVLSVYEKREVITCRGGERVEVRRQKYLQLQHT